MRLHQEEAGLTLLEIIIAIAITGLLVTTAVQIYLGIMQAQERASRGLRRDRAVQVFLDRF